MEEAQPQRGSVGRRKFPEKSAPKGWLSQHELMDLVKNFLEEVESELYENLRASRLARPRQHLCHPSEYIRREVLHMLRSKLPIKCRLTRSVTPPDFLDENLDSHYNNLFLQIYKCSHDRLQPKNKKRWEPCGQSIQWRAYGIILHNDINPEIFTYDVLTCRSIPG